MTRRAALLALLLALAAPLPAQELRLEGRSDAPAVRLAREILEAGRYVRIDRDTVLPESFRAPADLVVVDAEVKLEGMVEGRVAVLGGDLFVRPGARVAGPIAVVGGGVYPSGLAEVGEIVEDAVPLRVAVETDTVGGAVRAVRVIPPEEAAPLALPGAFGLRVPTYDRVDGLTVTWGPRWLVAGDEEGARADAWVSYRTARSEFGGGARAYLPLGVRGFLEARAARETSTSDAWIRGDLSNTLAALFVGTDERNYHESDRVSLTLGLRGDRGLVAGESELAPRVTLLLSRDRSLPTEDPWSLFGGLDRPNPSVDEGTLASATGAVGYRWRGRVSTFAGDAAVEQGFGGVGDFGFTQWTVDGLWESLAFRGHEVAVRVRATGTLDDDPAPRQRWSFVGGPNTLPTFEIATLRGDRLVYVASSYGVPLRAVTLPFLGFPFLRLTHRTGAAWVSGAPMPDWLQNLGAGLDFGLVQAGVYLDPAADGLSPELSFSLALPGVR